MIKVDEKSDTTTKVILSAVILFLLVALISIVFVFIVALK